MQQLTEFQVVMRLVPFGALSTDALQDAADRALAVLASEVPVIALGAVVGADLLQGVVETEFTVEATSASVLYPKLAQVIRALSNAGFELLESSEARLEHREHLQPA